VSVHVGELHTDVVSAGSAGPTGSTTGGAGSPTPDLEEHLFEVWRRQECRERRVAAEGPDD
jgi:hypothetical protein